MGLPEDRPHGEEVHVDAAGGVVRRRAVVVEQVLQNSVVEVRLVRGQKHHGLPRLRREQPLQLRAVVDDLVCVPLAVDHPDEPVHEVDDVRADARGDLPEVVAGAALHALGRQAGGSRE